MLSTETLFSKVEHSHYLTGKWYKKNILIKCVSMSNSLQGYCNLQLSFTMNFRCKFGLSLISLLPSLPELLRFTSLFNLLVGPDPPFCKLIIQVNVCYFHRNYDVVEVLQMNKWKNELCCVRKKLFKNFKKSKTLQKDWHCYTILLRKIASSHLESTSLSNHS